jgi:hypothetical protein
MEKQNPARLNPACVACGTQNPTGLRIAFFTDSEGVWANWTPTEGWESFRGVVHGGIISTVLDEAMSRAVVSQGWEALTTELTVRFRGRVSPGDELRLRGWIVDRRKRRIRTEASLATKTGEERAHAWGTFLSLPHHQQVSLGNNSEICPEVGSP